MGCVVPVTKKRSAELLTDLDIYLHAVRTQADGTTQKVTDRETKMSELDQKVQLLAEEAGRAGDLQTLLDSMAEEFESARRALETTKSALKEKSRENGQLEKELGAVGSVISPEKRVIHGLAECVCSSYTSSMRLQASSYHDRFNSVLGDVYVRRKKLGSSRVHVDEDGHSLYLWYENSDEKRGGRPPSPKSYDCSDGVLFLPSLVGPL